MSEDIIILYLSTFIMAFIVTEFIILIVKAFTKLFIFLAKRLPNLMKRSD